MAYFCAGENQSLSKAVEVTVEYHEVVIESVMPVSEHADIALGIGTTAGPEKVRSYWLCRFIQLACICTNMCFTIVPPFLEIFPRAYFKILLSGRGIGLKIALEFWTVLLKSSSN